MPRENDADPVSNTISMRVPPNKRDVIDRAAKLVGKTRTEFVIEAAFRAAEGVLLDQRVFYLDDASHKRFLEMLDEPVGDIDKLRALMAGKAPWEK
nr:DUF1778 domain-containing protein [uncultured Azospirillum sp.]